MQELPLWQQRLGPLLAPAAALNRLAVNARRGLHARKLLPTWIPPAPAVGVGGIRPQARGRLMVSAWLLGWAQARGLTAAAVMGPGDGSPGETPLSVRLDTPAAVCGAEAALLARYRPGAVVLVDTNPARAGASAWKNCQPDLLLLHDFFSDPTVSRRADIVPLSPQDLDKGWNRVFPAGSWSEGAKALGRASAFVLHLKPGEAPLRKPLAERRLAGFERPVFTVHPEIWRLRTPTGQTARDLGGEPYLLVAAQSNQDVAAQAAKDFLGLPPRLTVVFPDSHRFTPQDLAQMAADATRMRAPHVLATPEAAIRMGDVPGKTLWTFDPDVVLGPCLLSGREFTPWWEGVWAGLSASA